MAKKALCIVEQEPRVKELKQNLDDVHKHFEERFEWFKKKAKELDKELSAARKDAWLAIQEYCKERGWIPKWVDTYNDGIHSLGFIDGVLLLNTKEPDALNLPDDMPDDVKTLITALLGTEPQIKPKGPTH